MEPGFAMKKKRGAVKCEGANWTWSVEGTERLKAWS